MKKNHTNTLLYISVTVISLLFAGCSDNIFDEASRQHGEDRIQLSGDIDQLAVTRVNDNGFCDGDVMGVYIVDYEGGTPGTLTKRIRAYHKDMPKEKIKRGKIYEIIRT